METKSRYRATACAHVSFSASVDDRQRFSILSAAVSTVLVSNEAKIDTKTPNARFVENFGYITIASVIRQYDSSKPIALATLGRIQKLLLSMKFQPAELAEQGSDAMEEIAKVATTNNPLHNSPERCAIVLATNADS